MHRFVRHATLILSIALLPTLAQGAAIYNLQVEGLSCPFCAYGVEKKLKGVKGVQAVAVDLASGRVIVTMADGANLDEASARQAVKDAGFTLRAFEPAGQAR